MSALPAAIGTCDMGSAPSPGATASARFPAPLARGAGIRGNADPPHRFARPMLDGPDVIGVYGPTPASVTGIAGKTVFVVEPSCAVSERGSNATLESKRVWAGEKTQGGQPCMPHETQMRASEIEE